MSDIGIFLTVTAIVAAVMLLWTLTRMAVSARRNRRLARTLGFAGAHIVKFANSWTNAAAFDDADRKILLLGPGKHMLLSYSGVRDAGLATGSRDSYTDTHQVRDALFGAAVAGKTGAAIGWFASKPTKGQKYGPVYYDVHCVNDETFRFPLADYRLDTDSETDRLAYEKCRQFACEMDRCLRHAIQTADADS